MQRFLYFAHERLSPAELSAARIDGHLVELGEGYMPADAVETAAMRAASLRPLLMPADRRTVAAVQLSAAWIHGAIDDPPTRHCVQRAVAQRIKAPTTPRIAFRDVPVPPDDLVVLGGVLVTGPARTLGDLARIHATGNVAVDAAVVCAIDRLASQPGAARDAIIRLALGAALPGKRAALELLRDLEARYEVVTR